MSGDEHAGALVTTLDDAKRERLQPASGLRAELNRIADDLCGSIDGEHNLRLRAELDDALVQKLCISINFLLETVRRSATEAERERRELAETLDALEGQRELVHSLSTPLLRVRADMLVAPLVGVLDEARCEQLNHALLDEVALRQARFTILDVTGIALVDTRTAELLGARCVLCGIRPAVALTLAVLGWSWRG